MTRIEVLTGIDGTPHNAYVAFRPPLNAVQLAVVKEAMPALPFKQLDYPDSTELQIVDPRRNEQRLAKIARRAATALRASSERVTVIKTPMILAFSDESMFKQRDRFQFASYPSYNEQDLPIITPCGQGLSINTPQALDAQEYCADESRGIYQQCLSLASVVWNLPATVHEIRKRLGL